MYSYFNKILKKIISTKLKIKQKKFKIEFSTTF